MPAFITRLIIINIPAFLNIKKRSAFHPIAPDSPLPITIGHRGLAGTPIRAARRARCLGRGLCLHKTHVGCEYFCF